MNFCIDLAGFTFNIFRDPYSVPDTCSPLNIPSLINSCCPDITNPEILFPYSPATLKPIALDPSLEDHEIHSPYIPIGADYPYQDILYYIHTKRGTGYLRGENGGTNVEIGLLYTPDSNGNDIDYQWRLEYIEHTAHVYRILNANTQRGSRNLETGTGGNIRLNQRQTNDRQRWNLK